MRDRHAILLAEHAGDIVAVRAAVSALDPSIRILALGSLARLGRLEADVIGAALHDENRDVRCRAVEVSLGVMGAMGKQIDLVPLLSDTDDLVVETAAWALGECYANNPADTETAEVVAALSAVVFDHQESICREAAVAALGSIGSPAGLEPILAGLDDKATVRRRAVLALAPYSGEAVDDALERAIHDRDRQVRQAAEDLLGT